MYRTLGILGAAWLAVMVGSSEQAEAQNPPYLLLESPASSPFVQEAPRHSTHQYPTHQYRAHQYPAQQNCHPHHQAPERQPSSVGIGLQASPYAYGWFGQPRRTVHSRQTSYYGNFRQWTSR